MDFGTEWYAVIEKNSRELGHIVIWFYMDENEKYEINLTPQVGNLWNYFDKSK